jgi:hypothetical protein
MQLIFGPSALAQIWHIVILFASANLIIYQNLPEEEKRQLFIQLRGLKTEILIGHIGGPVAF